jgi:lysophospholipase
MPGDGRLVAHAKNPIPNGAISGLFKGFDGAPLRYARWEPSRSPRRGTVCVFHGRGEFIEKYFETIADLRRRGFAVATFDWRGQGGSVRELANPRKGYVRDFADHDRDLLRFMKDVVLPDCPPPFYALAHSTGGNILMRNATLDGSWFERMVLTAPLIRLARASLPFAQERVARLAEMACLVGLGARYAETKGRDDMFESMAFDGNPLTADPDRFQRNVDIIRLAPELGLGAATIYWVRAACRSMARINAPGFAPRVRVPLLLVAAGADRVVSSGAIEELSKRLKIGSYMMIPDSQHEILQERDDIRQQFWAVFDAYLLGDAAPTALAG